jgi:hypothetical protein
VPTTLTGRLAVDCRHQGKGHGELLLFDAFARTLNDAVFEESKIWPVVFVDAKRTYSVKLLQENFGWEPDLDVNGYHRMTDDQRQLVWQAHKELLAAFQVFTENAEKAGPHIS